MMKLIVFATLAATCLAIAGCTTDDYDGCHGTGCLVDNPDQKRRSAIDDRPQFDRNGNPNFDTQGNYQGCRGIGCQVDNPDNDGSSDDDSSSDDDDSE